MGRIAGVSPEETRERLIDAAARVFELKGFERATVAEIAREAGVTSGAIYAHYGTKAELLADALRCHGERATASLFPPDSPRDAATVLATLGSRLGTHDGSDSALLAEALLASRRDAELAQVLANALGEREALIAALVGAGQSGGVLTDEITPEVAARFSMMLGLGSLLIDDLDMPAVDPAEWTAFIRRFVAAFGPPAAGVIR
jgi:AcrR family transcriptional regulator